MAITEVTTETNAEDDAPPATDERDPATLIPAAVDEILELAQTWLAWDGAPILGDGNAWTPHKALRRVTDHLLDHLAEIEATLAGEPTVPDTWLGRTVTLDGDWARFTEGDLNEAANRLRRYAELYRVRLAGLTAAELDQPRPAAWTVRQIAHHVAGVTYYARQVGDLADRQPDAGRRPPRRVVLLSRQPRTAELARAKRPGKQDSPENGAEVHTIIPAGERLPGGSAGQPRLRQAGDQGLGGGDVGVERMVLLIGRQPLQALLVDGAQLCS